MKILVLLVSFIFTLFACTGDCLSCHQKLAPTINTDVRHMPMLTCIRCHAPNLNSKAECGANCYACHPMSKLRKAKVIEHEVIQECIDCHTTDLAKFLDSSYSSKQIGGDSLKEFLIQ